MARKKNKSRHKKSNVVNKKDSSAITADSNPNIVNETSPPPTYCNSETQQEMCITNLNTNNDSQTPVLPPFLFSLVNYLNSVPNIVEMLINSIKDNLNDLDIHVASNIRLYCDALSSHMNSTVKNAIEIALIHRVRECSSQNINHSNTGSKTDSSSQTEISLVENVSDEHHMQESQTTSSQNIPKLIRCFRCQFYNHYANGCKNKSYCAQCARTNYTKNCKKPSHCSNCIWTSNKLNLKLNIYHPGFSQNCPTYKLIACKNLRQETEN